MLEYRRHRRTHARARVLWARDPGELRTNIPYKHSVTHPEMHNVLLQEWAQAQGEAQA